MMISIPRTCPAAIAAVGFDMFTKGMEMPIHEHRKAQLILTLRGVVRCEAGSSVWIVPPRCAVWIPGNLPHSVTRRRKCRGLSLVRRSGCGVGAAGQCCTLSISPLLERLLLHVAQMPVLYDVDGADGRIATVLLDQLSAAPVEKLNFPMPIGAKLRKIAAR